MKGYAALFLLVKQEMNEACQGRGGTVPFSRAREEGRHPKVEEVRHFFWQVLERGAAKPSTSFVSVKQPGVGRGAAVGQEVNVVGFWLWRMVNPPAAEQKVVSVVVFLRRDFRLGLQQGWHLHFLKLLT